MTTTTTTTTTTMATFTKLRDGSWGIRGDKGLIGEAIATSAEVSVRKRNGEVTAAQPDHILWSGEGVAIAEVRPGPQRPFRQGRRRGRPTCTECGAHGPIGPCAECCGEGEII